VPTVVSADPQQLSPSMSFVSDYNNTGGGTLLLPRENSVPLLLNQEATNPYYTEDSDRPIRTFASKKGCTSATTNCISPSAFTRRIEDELNSLVESNSRQQNSFTHSHYHYRPEAVVTRNGGSRLTRSVTLFLSKTSSEGMREMYSSADGSQSRAMPATDQNNENCLAPSYSQALLLLQNEDSSQIRRTNSTFNGGESSTTARVSFNDQDSATRSLYGNSMIQHRNSEVVVQNSSARNAPVSSSRQSDDYYSVVDTTFSNGRELNNGFSGHGHYAFNITSINSSSNQSNMDGYHRNPSLYQQTQHQESSFQDASASSSSAATEADSFLHELGTSGNPCCHYTRSTSTYSIASSGELLNETETNCLLS